MPRHLIQILLSLSDSEGQSFPPSAYSHVRSELTERFSGMTAFARGPAEDLWEENGKTARDDIDSLRETRRSSVQIDKMAHVAAQGWIRAAVGFG